MTPCPLCDVSHVPNCLQLSLRRIEKQIHDAYKACFCCGGRFSDGIQIHTPDCEWCTLLQRVARIEAALTPKEDHGREAIPDTQRSAGGERCEHGRPIIGGIVDCAACFILAGPADSGEPPADSRPTEPSSTPPEPDPDGR